VLARVGKERITLGEFEAEWQRRRGGAEVAEVVEQRNRLLEELIAAKAVLAKARAAGFDQEPETAALIERLITARYLETEFARQFSESPLIGEAEVISFYESHSEQFIVPASVRAGISFFQVSPKAEPDKRAEIRERAEAVRAMARSADATGFTRLVGNQRVVVLHFSDVYRHNDLLGSWLPQHPTGRAVRRPPLHRSRT